MNQKLLGRFFHYLVVIGILIGLWLRVYPIVTEQVFFHFDSARDWLWVRDLVMSKKPILVGPWSSLQGVFYGPLTYYWLALFFVLFRGDPIGGSVAALVLQLVACGWFFWLVRKYLGLFVAELAIFFLALSPLTMRISTFIFQSNPSFLLGVAWLHSLWWLTHNDTRGMWLGALTVGLGMQTNLFMSAFLLPLFIAYCMRMRPRLNLKTFFIGVGIFATSLLPHVIFELRHEFLQIHSLINFLIGDNRSLGQPLSLINRLGDRVAVFRQLSNEFIPGLSAPVFWLIMVMVQFFGWRFWHQERAPKKQFLLLSCLSVVWFLVASLVFSGQMKMWYLYWALPILALSFAWWWEKVWHKQPLIILVFIIVLIAMQSFPTWLQFHTADFERDMKIYAHQKTVVEYVLSMAHEPFEVYTYTQAIYDYPYQYLWWWEWQKTGRGPVHYGYLPDKYDYVLNKYHYDPLPQTEATLSFPRRRESMINTIYLIMEPDNPGSDYRWETWGKAFYAFTREEHTILPSNVTIEKRVRRLPQQ